MLKTATHDSFIEGVIDASLNKLIIVDFWAPWCGPCKMLRPMLERLATEYGDALDVALVDVETETELANQYEIAGTPTVAFFSNGELVHRFTGVKALPALREDVDKFLK